MLRSMVIYFTVLYRAARCQSSCEFEALAVTVDYLRFDN